jgi:hypothetical protein
VPFDCSIALNPQISTLQGAAVLAEALARVTKTFGTRHVHVVAHSKAGMMARKFLKDNHDLNGLLKIGAISLTTLDTPHQGSVLADSVVLWNDSAFGGFANAILRLFNNLGFLGRGARDMTIDATRTLNGLIGDPPSRIDLLDAGANRSITIPFYYSTSADADADSNGSINAAEAFPYPQVFGNLTYNIVARGRRVNVFQALGLLRANAFSAVAPVLNDLIVPVQSARYFPFTEISSFIGFTGRSHARARCGRVSQCQSDVAPIILDRIRAAERAQPPPDQ